MGAGDEYVSLVPACRGKLCHPSPQVAYSEAAKLRRRLKQSNLMHYQCQHCGWWHVGRSVVDEVERGEAK